MFERYAEKSRRAIFFARAEAQKAGAKEIGTEHLLLGIVRDNTEMMRRLVGGRAAEEALGREIGKMTPLADKVKSLSAEAPLSNQSKRVLAYSAEEAEQLGSRIITPGHLLLGLMREKGSVAERALRAVCAELKTMRKAVALEPNEAGFRGNAGEVKIHSAYGHLREVTDWGTQDLKKAGFEGYTDKARRAIYFARWEASRRGTGTMEPEHLLLGIWREAAVELNELTERTDEWPELPERIAERMPPTDVPASEDMALSEELKEVLALAAEEARGMNLQVGVGHLALGLLRKRASFAGDLLRERGAEIERVRKAVREQLE